MSRLQKSPGATAASASATTAAAKPPKAAPTLSPMADPRLQDDDVPDEDLSLPDSGQIVLHPDGWYWLGADGRQQFGPYASFDEAQAEMHDSDEDAIETDATLLEAELEIGIADWVDPDTGEPAEGTHMRIEDH